MVVRVDEAGQHDAVGRIDNRGGVARDRDVRPHLADIAVLDQHVGAGEVAELAVEGEHDATLEQDAPLSLHAGELAAGSICATVAPATAAAPDLSEARREGATTVAVSSPALSHLNGRDVLQALHIAHPPVYDPLRRVVSR